MLYTELTPGACNECGPSFLESSAGLRVGPTILISKSGAPAAVARGVTTIGKSIPYGDDAIADSDRRDPAQRVSRERKALLVLRRLRRELPASRGPSSLYRNRYCLRVQSPGV